MVANERRRTDLPPTSQAKRRNEEESCYQYSSTFTAIPRQEAIIDIWNPVEIIIERKMLRWFEGEVHLHLSGECSGFVIKFLFWKWSWITSMKIRFDAISTLPWAISESDHNFPRQLWSYLYIMNSCLHCANDNLKFEITMNAHIQLSDTILPIAEARRQAIAPVCRIHSWRPTNNSNPQSFLF